MAQVTGVVNDADGFPEMDAEVIVRGTDKIVYTDENGKFNIDAKIGDILIINGKDFKVTSSDLGVVKFVEDNVSLDEVVITSIFDTPQKAGEKTIKNDNIKDFNPSLSVDQMLGGKVAGLTSQAQSGAPGSTANVTIRGALGLNGGVKSPLYVVDGTYMTAADMNTINPGDIESMRVLKDASQLAIYGARGANGVVIVKTKSAKKGGTTISYSTRVGVNQMMDLPNISVNNSRQSLEYQKGLFNNTGGKLGVDWSDDQIADLSKTNTNWADAAYKNGIVTSNYISIASNDGDISQSFSIGHDKNTGAVVYYKGFERVTSSYNFNVKAKNWLRYGANINGSYQTIDAPRDRFNSQSIFNAVLENQPYTDVYEYDANGKIKYDDAGYPVFNPNNGTGYPTLDEMAKRYNKNRQFRLYGSAFVDIDIIKNVTARSTFGASYLRQQIETFNRNDTYLAALLGSPNSKVDDSRDNLDYNWRNEVSYSNSWGKHHGRATVASEYQKTNNYRIYMSGRNFPTNNLITQGLAQEILGAGSSYTSREQIARYGYIGAVSYDYDRKYMADAYIRRDGTSLAGWDNLYGTFWGFSLGWDMAREEFLRGSKFVNSLVIKGSYGEVGDDSSIRAYQNLNLLNLGFYDGQFAGAPNTIVANPNLTWETNKKLNIGVDFGLMSNRLTGSAAYFQDKRNNFIFNQSLSPTAGGYKSVVNAGALTTSGFELDLNYDILRAKNYGLSVYANITSLKYKVNSLDGTNEVFPDGTAESLVHQVGKTPYQFYMVRWAGVDSQTGDALYYDKDGNVTNVYSSGDAVATGKTPLPKVFGGFGLSGNVYGFDVNADFTYSAGAYAYNNVYDWLTDSSNYDTNKDVSANNYWREPGDKAQFARPTATGNQYSTQYLEKNDYILFRSLSVGYNLSNKVLENTPLKSLRFYAQVQNLAIFTNFHGNPIQGTGSSESSSVTSSGYVSNSFSGFGYPMVRTYALGLNVSF